MFEYKIYDAGSAPATLFKFRYDVYINELKRTQSYADHEKGTIIDPLDKTGQQAVVKYKGDIIACARANVLRDGPVGPYFQLYELNKLSDDEVAKASIVTLDMVHKNFRKTAVFSRMMQMLYVLGIKRETQFCYMDVNPPLQPLFEKLGFKKIAEKHHFDYGDIVIMKMDILDIDHLNKQKSPFRRVYKQIFSDPNFIATGSYDHITIK